MSGAPNNVNIFEEQLKDIVKQILEKEKTIPASPVPVNNTGSNTSVDFSSITTEDEFKTQINNFVEQIFKNISDEMSSLTVKKRIPNETNIDYIMKNINEIKNNINNINIKVGNNIDDAISIMFNAIMKKYGEINTNGIYIDVKDTVIKQDGCSNDVICDIQDYYDSITLNLSDLFNLSLNNSQNSNQDAEKKILKVLRKEITHFYSNIINNKYRLLNLWSLYNMPKKMFTEKFKLLNSPDHKKTSKINMNISKYHVTKDEDGKSIMRPINVSHSGKNASKFMDIDEQFFRIKKKGKGNPITDKKKEIIEIDS